MSSSSKLFPLISKLYIVLLVISESFGVPDNPDLQIELKSSSSSATSIPSCEAEIRRICGKKENFNDLDALDCILNQKRDEAAELNDKCNHELWVYRKSITERDGFLKLLGEECVDAFKTSIDDCWRPENDKGLTACIIENKEKLELPRCKAMVTRLESLIFGDFELMSRFANKCLNDIQKFHCGRNQVESAKKLQLPHTQGRTIECLSARVQDLTDTCAVEILRIAELQVDDFHLDRALYFACRDDRERFCKEVNAGNGKVYKCLVRHKLEREMSSECREQIYRRQRLGWQDYRASGIVASCKAEIRRLKCRRETSATADKQVRLSQILLCLENAAHMGGVEINGECMAEIKQHRRALMEDYRLTPELLAACSEEQKSYCAERGVNGNTIHCLMALAQTRKTERMISDRCRAGLENLVRITDVSSDWRVDPVLQQSCREVVQKSSCSSVANNRVLDCLMGILTSDANQGIDANAMTDQCETTLLQIQYFISRQFPLDSVLFEVCKEDAHKICGTSGEWSPDPNLMVPSRGPLVLSCLFRNIGSEDSSNQVSRQCAEKVKETMRRRAIYVRLMPEVEEPCLEDLADYCSDKNKPGEELACLQDNLEQLKKPECKIAVSNFTEVEMKNPTINPYLYKYCHDLIDTKCSDDKSEDSDVLECLIELKPEMKNKKCRASVEHLQLLRLKDFNFTPKFKSQCHEHVVRNCKKDKKMTAASLVACLSEIIRNDTLTESTQRITKGCRKQVRNLLLSKIQLENMNSRLDQSSMYSVCKNSVGKHCDQVKPGGGRILECMTQPDTKALLMKEDPNCFRALMKIQQDISNDAGLDLHLQQDCAKEIKFFCHDRSDDLVSCLLKSSTQNRAAEAFDDDVCGKTLRMRLIQQNSDFRLNPRLRKACKLDIPKFCGNVQYGEGRVLACLKSVFVQPKSRLSKPCKEYVTSTIEEAAQKDIRIDNALYVACKEDIEISCKATMDVDEKTGDGGKTEECLKNVFKENKLHFESCRDQVKQLIQSTMVDIHVDPILHQACSIDLIKRCDDVPPGEGRLIGCLLAILQEDKAKMTSRLSVQCRETLSLRSELFQVAGSAKLESIQDIYDQVQKSPHKNYFLTVAMTVVGLIFIFGLFCGRATRKKAEFKDK